MSRRTAHLSNKNASRASEYLLVSGGGTRTHRLEICRSELTGEVCMCRALWAVESIMERMEVSGEALCAQVYSARRLPPQ